MSNLKKKKKIIKGAPGRPRLSVFRSHQAIYAQIIDDQAGKTLVSAHSREVEKTDPKVAKTELALKVGEILAQKALKKKIKKVIFDRGRFRYHGRVKALAEGARKKGLEF